MVIHYNSRGKAFHHGTYSNRLRADRRQREIQNGFYAKRIPFEEWPQVWVIPVEVDADADHYM
jgi:hypothetical protein